MKNRYEPKDYDRIFDEMWTLNDRSIILVASSLLGHSLEKLISSRLRKPNTSKEKEVLFSDFGILGSFSQQIWMAYFINLIGPNTRQDLDKIRLIRNVCAHDMNPISFDQEELSSRIQSLHFPKVSPDLKSKEPNLKRAFIVTSLVYSASMMLRSTEDIGEINKVAAILEE